MLRARVPRIALSGGTPGQFDGQTVTATASLVAGSMTGAAMFAGAVITVSASLIAGSLTGAAAFAGQTTTATASLIPGALTGAGSFSGQTATAVASLIRGTMTGGGSGGGADPAAVWAYELRPGLTAADAILAIYDKVQGFTFTVPGVADVNVQYVNDVQVKGTGQPGNEWGPV